MNRWKQVGPEWRTEEVFRVRELLKCEHVPFKMPFSDVFFTSLFHTPAEDKKWGVLVREKDWKKAVALLEQEGLCAGGNLLPAHGSLPEARHKPLSDAVWPERVLTGSAKAV